MRDQAGIDERVKALRCVQGSKRARAALGEVAQTAARRFQASPYVALRAITCELREGVLVLHGQVASYFHKQLAQETARDVAGGGPIVNGVEVVQAANGDSKRTAAG